MLYCCWIIGLVLLGPCPAWGVAYWQQLVLMALLRTLTHLLALAACLCQARQLGAVHTLHTTPTLLLPDDAVVAFCSGSGTSLHAYDYFCMHT